MQTVFNTRIERLSADFKQSLQAVYGNQLVSLVLFGSYARGDFYPESDVDFAVVLRDPMIRPTAEILRLSPITAELSLKHEIIVSVLPGSEQKLNTSQQAVYEAIRKEGVSL